jgi:small subunit ribosomal protein S3
MIHKKIVQQKIKEFEIQSYVKDGLKGVGLSKTKLQITPLGEKIIVSASRPGLIVGRKGQSIKKLTGLLKKKFNLENPQIEIDEVKDIKQDPVIIAENIASYLEKFGAGRFKSIGHKSLENAINGGAMGIEVLISGKVPSSRAKRWRFYKGYLKKCGDVAVNGVKKAYCIANLKTGVIGIQVRIMSSDIKLPDSVQILDEPITIIEDENLSNDNENKNDNQNIDLDKEKSTKDKKKTVKKKSVKKSVKKAVKK